MGENTFKGKEDDSSKDLSHDRFSLKQIEYKNGGGKGDNQAKSSMDNTKSVSKTPQLVKLSDIVMDPDIQIREKLDKNRLKEYTEKLKDGIIPPPIVVFFDGERNLITDGFHRFAAATEAGKQHIMAEVRTGSIRDASIHAAIANANHGLDLTNKEKRKAVIRLLSDHEWSGWSNSAIAQASGFSHVFIGKVRKEKFPDQSEHRKTTKGGIMNTQNIGPKEKSDGEFKVTTVREFLDQRNASLSAQKTEAPINPLTAIIEGSSDIMPEPLLKLQEENARLKDEIEHWKREAEKHKKWHTDLVLEIAQDLMDIETCNCYQISEEQ